MKKRKYEPPVARDLSSGAASGQQPPPQPQGICYAGSAPGQVGACNPTGLLPAWGCGTGANPWQICAVGSAQR